MPEHVQNLWQEIAFVEFFFVCTKMRLFFRAGLGNDF